jgi:hypothetical protein
MGPLELDLIRQEEAAARQQAQENTQLQQVDPTLVEQSTPEALKPKGKAKFGQRILNLGKQTIKLILPKLTFFVTMKNLEEMPKFITPFDVLGEQTKKTDFKLQTQTKLSKHDFCVFRQI